MQLELLKKEKKRKTMGPLIKIMWVVFFLMPRMMKMMVMEKLKKIIQ